MASLAEIKWLQNLVEYLLDQLGELLRVVAFHCFQHALFQELQFLSGVQVVVYYHASDAIRVLFQFLLTEVLQNWQIFSHCACVYTHFVASAAWLLLASLWLCWWRLFNSFFLQNWNLSEKVSWICKEIMRVLYSVCHRLLSRNEFVKMLNILMMLIVLQLLLFRWKSS